MTEYKEYKEIWSIPETRLRSFFEKSYGAVFEENRAFIGNVKAQIIPLEPNNILKVPIPRSEVVMTGPEAETEEIHRRFVLNFLSAGG